MSIARALRTKGLSLFVVWMLAASLLVGLASLFPASAQNCDRSGGPTSGDWIVTDAQVCQDIVIVMDGDLSITGTGSLTIRNGGLKFVEDTAHVYSVSVAAGGSLIFEDSKMWTETSLINPYLKLAVTISGTLNTSNSILAFPGTIDSTAGAFVHLRDGSIIKRTETNLLGVFSDAAVRDENDDAPGLTFTSSTVNFYASRVESLYENETLAAPDNRQSIRLLGTTVLTAIDTFLAIDFCCLGGAVETHNTLSLAGTSRAYLYGVTTDTQETAAYARDQWISAISTPSGTGAFLYRWASVRVVDANVVPVPNADLNAFFSGPETGLANYSDNGGAAFPPVGVRGYMGGKTGGAAGNWDDTDVTGIARIPLPTDWIDNSTQPDSRFVGTFQVDATSGVHTGSSPLTFDAYPDMGANGTQKSLTVTLGTLVQPLPDLTPLPPTFVPATPKELQNVSITAPIANQGAGGAANVLVRVFDGVTPLLETTIPFIGAGGQQTVATLLRNATAGQHVIRVSVDPNTAINEGPPGSPQETNNLRGFQLSVTPLGPDLEVAVSFNPDPGFLNNPVQLVAGVTNLGDRNASNILVQYYIQANQPDALSTPVGTATVDYVEVGGAGTAVLNWTPTSLGSFTVWAWADPQDQIPEPAPYLEANNLASNILAVNPAPDLVTNLQDLSMTDPVPRVNQAVNLEAVVRNTGQATSGVGFRVDFLVDGSVVGSQGLPALAAGQKTTTTFGPVTFTACGTHTIGVNVDAGGVVVEGSLYELNNQVTAPVQVYPDLQYTWASGAITADQAFARNVEITGPVSITGSQVTIVQSESPCERYYVKVLSGGSLTIADSTITSNWPLVVFVASGGTLTATNATFGLDVQGKGALHSRGTLSVWDSTVSGDLIAKGASADLRGDTFGGSLLHIDSSGMSRIWDSTFPGVTTIQLASDAPGPGAVDFDIRNATFDAGLTSQLVFSGDQWVHLTSGTLTKAGDWWTGMLTQSAHVTRYWWLTVETVDGTGTRIQDPTTTVDLKRFNPTTLAWDPIPPCTPGDCYLNSNNSWPFVGVPKGVLLYRAPAEERYGPQSVQPDLVQATYIGAGRAFIEGQVRLPDRDESALVTADSTITLTFSELTPDLSVTAIQFNGGNGNNVASQPTARPLNIVSTVANAGEIISRNVIVYCYDADVDVNRDGYMDNSHSFYVNSNNFISQAGPTNVSALSSAPFSCPWTPLAILEGSLTISVVVDPPIGSDPRSGGAIAEVNEANNLRTSTIVIFTWPDLHLAADPVISFEPPTPILNNNVVLTIQVSNEGTTVATGAIFGIYDLANNPISPTATANVARAATTTVTLTWVPAAAGPVTIRIRVNASGAVFPGDYENWDFDLTDNSADKQFDVQTQPELSVVFRDPPADAFRNQPFQINLTVSNTGQTTAPAVTITVVDEANPLVILGSAYGVTVPALDTQDVILNTELGIGLLGARTIIVTVDKNQTVNELDETNNNATATITVIAPNGSVRLEQPADQQEVRPGTTIAVRGKVLQTGAFEGTPIGGVVVTITLVDAQGQTVPGANATATSASNDGTFLVGIAIPANLPNGRYAVRANALDTSIADLDRQIIITTPVAWWQSPFLGLPVWIWLIVIIGAAAAIGGGTAYVKFVGLGKLVECGECGSFIPEDSVKCPKCGVEFEKDMAKCSNCQAWIPVDVKQCPECGVEFATGEVEMADYEAQMRRQYDEVKRKFREEAARELGRSLSEREFEDWWRAQPTFVTFEDWLREEEEMRRMGSKPCPVCNTLNSVTATVCHKCGTLLKEDARRPGGGRPPAAAPRPATPAPAQAFQPPSGEGGAEAMPSDAIPKKVVKKPVMGAPVVQKKVIKRPLDEQKEGEGGEGTGGDEEQI